MLVPNPMRIDDVPITTPCGASFDGMSAVDAARRMCASCNKLVHDLSAMSEADARTTVADGPVCVRYLYDVHGNVLFSAPPGARVVPAGALLSKATKSRWLRAAALAATAIVFEACGGNDGAARDVGVERNTREPDADAGSPTTPPPRVAADAGVDDDASTDAGAEAASEQDGG